MPLAKMEPAVVEERDKIIKKKKKVESVQSKGNMKITDHFKTPEKDVQQVSKQKSLLQFFAKSPAAVITTSEAKKKAISDKENTLSRKSIVFPKWTSSEDTNTPKLGSLQDGVDSKKQNCIEISDDSMDNKEIENDKVAEKDDNSDSVIMLSDTSVDTTDTDKTSVRKSEKSKVGRKKNSKESKEESADTGEKYKAEDKKKVKNETCSEDKVTECINDNNKCGKDEGADMEEENLNLAEDKRHLKEEKPRIGSAEEIAIAVNDKNAKNQEEIELIQAVITANSEDSKGQLLKKNTLKGSEMMSLLKEIKNSEKKEKRKKHKHKEKTKEKVHVVEIADPDYTASEEKNDTGKSEDSVVNCLAERESSVDVPQKEGRFKRQNVGGKNKQGRTLLKEKSKLKKNESVEEPTTKRNDTGKSFREGAIEEKTKSNNEPKCQTSECKEEKKVKEMTYAEYLQTVDNHVDDETETECFTKIIDTGEYKNEILELTEELKVEKAGLKSSKSEMLGTSTGIARFFNVKTSTPNKLKELSVQSDSQDKIEVSKDKIQESSSSEGSENLTKECTRTKKSCKKERKKKSDSDLEISIIEETSVTQKSQFLKSGDKTLFPKKTQQSVLSFGSAGLKMSKQAADKPAATGTEKDKETCDNVPKPAKRGRKKKVVEVHVDEKDILDTSESMFEAPRRGRKRKKEERTNSTDLEESVFTSGTDETGERRRSSRKKYRVTAFQMDYQQKTPIKLKLKRCGKSSSSGDEELAHLKAMKHQVKLKLTKAQALLEKARKNQQKYKTKGVVTKVDGEEKPVKKEKKDKAKHEKIANDSTRRSSRLVGKSLPSMEEVSLDNIVISSDDEEHTKEEPIVRKRGRPKGSVKTFATPKKDTLSRKDVPKTGTPGKNPAKTESPKKSAGTPRKTKSPKKGAKLAPLFMMGKTKGQAPSPVKPPLDPEQAKQRQQFLMSGVPEELRKQTATRLAAVIEADYPPIPEINHVQQIPADVSGDGSWNLNKVDLRLRPFLISDPPTPVTRFDGGLARNSSSDQDLAYIQKFHCHAKIEESLVVECLGEVTTFNPIYPVQKVYKALKQNLPVITAGLKTEDNKTAKTNEDVVTIDDGEVPPKKRARRSLKLNKKGEGEGGQEQNKEQAAEQKKVEVSGKGPCILWTDKYCPSNTSEILGNGTVLKKLKNWLGEWKHVLDREAKKARKLLMKKNKGKVTAKTDTDDQWDDDSDFDMDSEDSEDDTSLCNTMLLVGPNGCGKTCSVYALAQELGFKVHEVNASASRSGRHILSQLQEATQSHQVSSQGCSTPSKKTAPVSNEKPVNARLSASFSNFFQKATDVKPDNKSKEKKRKRNMSAETSPDKKRRKKERDARKPAVIDENSQGWTHAINLTSTTMILFDEVDVFFEEDRGFLSAIQTFMSTTKIPIILTTSDPGFTAMFDGRYEQLTLRPPPVRSVVSRLQTIALLENVRTDYDSLSELVQCHRGDVRKCVVSLQFLLDSGGSHIQKYRVPQRPGAGGQTLPTVVEDSQDCSQGEYSCPGAQTTVKADSKERDFEEDDDDFVVVKPMQARRKRMFEDESSVSGETFAEVFLRKQAGSGSANCENEADARKYPPVHVVGVEACYGIGREKGLELLESLLKYLKGDSARSGHVVDVCCTLRKSIDCNILHGNLPVLLPLALKVVDSVAKATVDKKVAPQRKRIRNDLYDSEASNDATGGDDEDDDDDEPVEQEEENAKTCRREENLCLSRALSSFASFYDTMSALDVLESSESRWVMDNLQSVGGRELRGRLVSGMETSLPSHPSHTGLDLDPVLDYSMEVEARSACKMYKEVDEVQSQVEKLCNNNPAFSEEFVLPVMKGRETFRLSSSDIVSKPTEARRAWDNVQDSLPLVTHKQRRKLHTDYLPTLREMCRFEQCRQLTNTKRRFQHYFDSVNFSLRDRTIGMLSTTFL